MAFSVEKKWRINETERISGVKRTGLIYTKEKKGKKMCPRCNQQRDVPLKNCILTVVSFLLSETVKV